MLSDYVTSRLTHFIYVGMAEGLGTTGRLHVTTHPSIPTAGALLADASATARHTVKMARLTLIPM